MMSKKCMECGSTKAVLPVIKSFLTMEIEPLCTECIINKGEKKVKKSSLNPAGAD